MACCNPCTCPPKFYTATPCCEKDAGSLGVLFCFFSKPRCKFTGQLYEQTVICPWHWCEKRKQKVHSVGSKENLVCGALFGCLGNFFAFLTLFILLGSAYLRRDGNQAFKGIVSAGITYAGIGVSIGSGGIAAIPAIIATALLLIMVPTLIDWFFVGRSDEAYAEPCFKFCSMCPFFGKMGVDPEALRSGAE